MGPGQKSALDAGPPLFALTRSAMAASGVLRGQTAVASANVVRTRQGSRQRRGAPENVSLAAELLSQPAVLRTRSRREQLLSVSASLAPADDPREERDAGFSASIRVPNTMVQIGPQLGGKGGGAAVLERTGLNLSQQSQEFSAKTDDTGGGGSNGGKVNNGGSGGDGDEGDDDDYFDDKDDDGADEGFFHTRQVLPELFDRATLDCVLAEWFKTIVDLPAGLRMAVEMGLVSSLQLARFLSVDCRPTVVRAVTRYMPLAQSRAFVGRLMADPSFIMKLGVEQLITLASAVAYEAQQRGSKLSKEADLATVNVLSLLAANAAVVWTLAPTRSYGEPLKFAWQRVLHQLPNYVFDTCGPLRQYTAVSRTSAFVYKAAQLSAAGVAIGALSSFAATGLVNLRRRSDPTFQPAVPVPDLRTAALGTGAWMGLTSNFRYQLIGGADLWMHQRLSSLSTSTAATIFARLGNNFVGDLTRLHLLGLPTMPPPSAMFAGAAAGAAALAGTSRPSAGSAKRRVKRRTAAASAAAGSSGAAGGVVHRRASSTASAQAAAQAPGSFSVSARRAE